MSPIKKSFQKYLILSVLLTIIAFGLNLYLKPGILLPVWLIGISLGFILYRSGICFSAVFRDLIMFRDFSMARTMLIILVISFIGINVLQILAHQNGQIIPGKFHSVGIHTAVGGFMFGLGMVLAGGCASGTIQRIGEGFVVFWFVLISMGIGSVLGAYHYAWWTTNFFSHKPVFFSNVVGWLNGSLISLFTLGSLFLVSFVIEKGLLKQDKRCANWQRKG